VRDNLSAQRKTDEVDESIWKDLANELCEIFADGLCPGVGSCEGIAFILIDHSEADPCEVGQESHTSNQVDGIEDEVFCQIGDIKTGLLESAAFPCEGV
jgi:hypothetical protein